MEKCNYECYNCRNFRRYFIKKKTEFQRTKFGFCREKQENVGIHGKCECFKYKQVSYSTDTSVKWRLDSLLTEITTLRSILEEEAREQVYEKGGYGMYACDEYLCTVTEEFTDKKSGCVRWQERVQFCELTVERLGRAEEDIAAIRQILKEKKILFVTFRRRKRRIKKKR